MRRVRYRPVTWLVIAAGVASAACSAGRVEPAIQATATADQPGDTSGILRVLALRLSEEASPSLLVVRGAFTVPSMQTGAPPPPGGVAGVDRALAVFAASAGALIDPWRGPDSPWESAFLVSRPQPVPNGEREQRAVIVSLYRPRIAGTGASVDVSLRVLRPGKAHESAPEVWRYIMARRSPREGWTFDRRELVVAY